MLRAGLCILELRACIVAGICVGAGESSSAVRGGPVRRAGWEVGTVAIGLVADVFVAFSATHEEPSDGAAEGLDHIVEVEGIPEGTSAQEAALVGRLVGGVAWHGLRCNVGGLLDIVHCPGKGPQVKDAENGHFNAEEH